MVQLHQTLIFGIIVEGAGEVVMVEGAEVVFRYVGLLELFERGDDDFCWCGWGATYAEDDEGGDMAVLRVRPSSTTVFSTPLSHE